MTTAILPIASVESRSASVADVRCPRCDYDLSAIPPTWEEFCPTAGVCSECGLSYAWADVLTTERVVPRWSVDHPMTSIARTMPLSVLRAASPRRFWNAVRLEHPVRVRAWVAACVVALLLFQALQAALGLAVQFINPLGFTPGGAYGYPFMGAWPWIEPKHAVPGGGVRSIVWCTVLAPIVLVLLSDTRRVARVSWRHAVRIGAVGVLGVLAWSSVMTVIGTLTTWWLYSMPYNAPMARPAQLLQLAVYVFAIPLLGWVWLVWLWAVAVSRHLGLRRPGVVTAVVMGCASLASLLLA